jgi:hypothetical protein
VFDADADDVVTEDESRQILESIASAQKAVVSELFASHVRQTQIEWHQMPMLTLAR